MALLRTASPSDLGPVIESDFVMLRTPQMSDYPAWAELRAQSRDFLMPWEPLWASDELSRASFRRRVRHYLRDLREDVGYALFIFAATTGDLVGGLTLCNVRRGVTQSCTLGYWVGARYANQGYMTATVRAVIPFVFDQLELHRLEAAYRVGALPSKAAREARLAEIRSVRLITLNYCPMGCTFCSATNFPIPSLMRRPARITSGW